ncbi:MAG: TldD protein, part of proposed TldE/TldD proteolytic complex [Marinimicrobia bacterium 46_47]|nr:MAG: TldD protein, part of proposed TldE/TldD proteolytic complex [Marinimicrobia bacterium 46_47]KUK91249.1 MAG: peptidase U62 modulator of DNA gyrase [Marinimicrobia bacterium 46_43]
MKKITRRDFIKTGTAGIILAGMPLTLSNCLKRPGSAAPKNLGEYFSFFGVDEEIIRKTLETALSEGGDYADLFFEYSTGNSVVMENNTVNRAYIESSLGMGVRVLKGDKTGYSFTEEISPEKMQSVARTAAKIAGSPGQKEIKPLKERELPDYYPIITRWEDVSIKKRIQMLEFVNNEMLKRDTQIQATQLNFTDNERLILIATSEGVLAGDYQPMTRFNASCVAEAKGRRENNGFNLSARQDINWYTRDKLMYLAREAVKRTVALFDAVPAPAGEMPVVLAAGSAGILLHEAIGHGMEADFNRKGISIFSDRMNKKVAEPFVSIVDDGTNLNIRGSINVDDEGIPGQKTYLVENGILRSYMHDRISAQYYGLNPTGNGRRESFKYPPQPRMRNTYMLNGPHTFEEIIHNTSHGIYADQFLNGEVHIGAGDFTFYVKSGYMIENGKLTRPVKDINIIGNGPDVLSKITMVANDLKLAEGGWTCGKGGQSVPVSQGIPTCKVSSITVGGKNI